MSDLRIRSTSRSSADVSDIILRHTVTTRLVFRATLVNNPSDQSASVKGSFLFQRKGPKEQWSDIPITPLSTLKKGEGYKLELHSQELLELHSQLDALYRLFAREGIPLGELHYVQANEAVIALSKLNVDQLHQYLDANVTVGANLIARLLAWASKSDHVGELVELLEKVGHQALGNLGTAVSLGAIKEALGIWETGANEDSEEFWQSFLTERSFLLEQLFSWPCTVVSDKAYMGGKSVENKGGNIIDFLVKNQLTDSAALVEIKTPSTLLVGREYRTGVPNVSTELTGGLVQVLSYKASLNETYRTMGRSNPPYEVFDPPCVVIIGRAASLAVEQRRTFELFRRQLTDVDIVTFDELFGRLQGLVEVLESRTP